MFGFIVFVIAIIIALFKAIGSVLTGGAQKFDTYVIVKSRQTLEKYDAKEFFKENKEKLTEVENIIKGKKTSDGILGDYKIMVRYSSPARRSSASKIIVVRQSDIDMFKKDPSLLMSKEEYNKLLKEQQKESLNQKQHEYYERVNSIIDYANENRDSLIIKGSREQVDSLIGRLFDKTINSIRKIKTLESKEWTLIGDFIVHIKREIEMVVSKNQQILEYYESPSFLKVKETCEALMSSQREFNEYINEKVQSISKLFGTRVVRNETINNDGYDYIRPYKKTITPFTAEVSATVFASAENKPLEYIVKYFYPNKNKYPEQIQKLCRLVEELETLRDAKQIIENYKLEYQQYLMDVPAFIMQNDEAGFYSRLGFATIDESVLTVAYKFSYTSGGGMAQRFFTVPMTEENISELIRILESKLTASAFAKEQRTLMTKKLREFIKKRDNYTCRDCGNSTYKEPNLLLEIDHIIPVAKGGRTVKNNLQTLCWKCNRTKSDKIIDID